MVVGGSAAPALKLLSALIWFQFSSRASTLEEIYWKVSESAPRGRATECLVTECLYYWMPILLNAYITECLESWMPSSWMPMQH